MKIKAIKEKAINWVAETYIGISFYYVRLCNFINNINETILDGW